MNLGKMLTEALRANCGPDGFYAEPIPPDRNHYSHHRIDGGVDLDAAAESFLAKVREAEGLAEQDRRVAAWARVLHPEAKLKIDDHTGPVPYLGEVE